jgi:hypothetical protein
VKISLFKHLKPLSPSAHLALALVFAAASQGCGRAAPQQSNQIPARDLSEAQLLAKQGALTCADARNCPSSVALLTAAKADAVSLCTAFLIAPDLMATNSHCIPDDLKKAGSDCSSRIWVKFADQPGAPGEQAGCKSISHASKVDLSLPDYAFFKLDRALSRPVLPFSHEGFADGAQYSVDKVNPLSKTAPLGSLERVRCKTPHGTLLVPGSDSELSPLMTLADCEIVHGNSGSPIFDETGKIRGIVQATEIQDKLRSGLADKDIELVDGELAPLGVGTSFACVRAPSEPASLVLADGCLAQQNVEKPAKWTKNFDLEAQKAIALWDASKTPFASRFEWADSGELSKDGKFTVAPRCFKGALDWTDPSQASQTLDLDLPLWSSRAGVNRYLQPSYRFVLGSRPLRARLAFSPAQLRSGMSSVTLSSDSLGPSSSPTIFDGAIPVCK